MPTEMLRPIELYFPIERIDEEERTFSGHAFVNEVVEGENGIRLKRSAMEAATPDFLHWSALREMHQPSAVGTALAVEWDEKGAHFTGKVVDDNAWKKVKARVYKGLSVGVVPVLMRGKDVEQCRWVETSLVDRPKDPGAVITCFRAEGFDPAAEVPVEVLPEEPPPDPGTPIADLVDETTRAALAELARAEPEPIILTPTEQPLTREDAAAGSKTVETTEAASPPAFSFPVPESWTSAHIQQFSQALTEAMGVVARAQTSETVPTRENLEGKTPPRLHGALHYDCGAEQCHSHRQHAAAQRCVEMGMNRGAAAAPDDPAAGADVPADRIADLVGLLRGELAAAPADAEIQALLRELAAEFARTEKPAGDYGADAGYADPGLQPDKKPRYPLKEDGKLSPDRVRAAWSYINQAKNREPYSAADLEKIEAKIRAAAKELGIEISEERGEIPALEDETMDLTELTARLERLETQPPETATLFTRLETAETRLTAAEGENARLTAQVERLAAQPAPVKGPVRFAGLPRTFGANTPEDLDGDDPEALAAELQRLEAEGQKPEIRQNARLQDQLVAQISATKRRLAAVRGG